MNNWPPSQSKERRSDWPLKVCYRVLPCATVRYRVLRCAMWRDWMEGLDDLVVRRSGAERVKGLDCQSVRGEKSKKKDLFSCHNKSAERKHVANTRQCVCQPIRFVWDGWGFIPNDTHNYEKRRYWRAKTHTRWGGRVTSEERRPGDCVWRRTCRNSWRRASFLRIMRKVYVTGAE